MRKYANIIDKKTKQCDVGLGTDSAFYKSLGMKEMDVEQSWDGSWYVAGYCPEKPTPTYEEIDQLRIEYRKEHIDDKTIARMRKTANGTWTEEDEQAYLELDAEVTAYIEEHYPYPVEGENE